MNIENYLSSESFTMIPKSYMLDGVRNLIHQINERLNTSQPIFMPGTPGSSMGDEYYLQEIKHMGDELKRAVQDIRVEVNQYQKQLEKFESDRNTIQIRMVHLNHEETRNQFNEADQKCTNLINDLNYIIEESNQVITEAEMLLSRMQMISIPAFQSRNEFRPSFIEYQSNQIDYPQKNVQPDIDDEISHLINLDNKMLITNEKKYLDQI